MDQMKEFCQELVAEMFSDKDRPLVAERLRQELETIQVSDQVGAFEKARKAVQRLSGQGVSCRLTGAGCSSLISYLMNFSQIDPTEHGLPYERFLNANPAGTIQFKFLANSQINRSEEDFTVILDEASCDLISFRNETPLARIPSRVVEEIRRTDADFNLSSIPLNDQATFELLRSGDVEGISQFEGNGIRGSRIDLKPRCLTDIAAITAVQLGEAHETGILNEYVRRGFKREHQETEDCLVSEILQETRGMILFQEQIMLIMNRAADIPLAEAYAFIQAVCKRHWEQVAMFREWFVAQLLGNGEGEPEALRLFEKIRDAATRAVCKSHHLAEALTTYQAAYLKAHFPREFSQTLQNIQH